MNRLLKIFFATFMIITLGSSFGKDGKIKESERMNEGEKITITIGETVFSATLNDNKSSRAFYKLLEKESVTLDMHDYGGFEKSGDLGANIERSDKNTKVGPGDFILYQGHIIAIYYGTNEWNFTLLGHIDGATKEKMRSVLRAGGKNVSVKFSVP